MQTLLVPIDFSTTALNAAIYAANFSLEIDAQRLVLFHTTIGTDKSEQEAATILAYAEQEMKIVAQQLQDIAPQIKIVTVINDAYLLKGIESLYQEYDISLVIMGITGKNFIEQKLIGSNTLTVVKTKGIPVLVIPAACKYEPVRNVGLAIQYKTNNPKHIPAAYIAELCQKLSAHLAIINIDNQNADVSTLQLKSRQDEFEAALNNVQLSFHYMKDGGVSNSLYSFIYQMNLDLIIALTEESSFLKAIYKQGLAQTLPYKINKPILIMKP